MTHSLHRITLLILIGFAMVAISLVYWSAFASDSMLARLDNPRLVEAERALQRGGLYDRTGIILAQTLDAGISPSGKRIVRRDYPVPAVSSPIGYYSLVHGVGGAEAAFDVQLRGNDLRDAINAAAGSILHTPQVGSDIRLTISADLQQKILASIQHKQAAVVAIEVPSGAILAMVSTPTFDPNTLDANFAELQRDPSAPLLNRVTQGLYQPGGALQTVVLAAMLNDRVDVTLPASGATAPVMIDGQSLNCAQQGTAVSTADAYTLACPAPFVAATVEHPTALQNMLDAFGLLRRPQLPNFETLSGKPVIPLTDSLDSTVLRAEGAGQGLLTVTPLQMALVAATIANHGNAVTPYLGDAIRVPGSHDWKALPPPDEQRAIVTQTIADTIGDVMSGAVDSGAAKAARRPNLAIRGHASIAYIGPDRKQAAWFIGYVDLPDGRSVAIAVVINDADASIAADIGGTTLSDAVQLLK